MDPQLQHRLMLFAGFIPGGIATLVLLAAWYIHAFRLSRLDLEHETDQPAITPRGPRWLLPVLLVIGVAGADYAVNARFVLWPDDNTARYPHALALIALLGVAEGIVALPVLIAALLRLLTYAGAFWMLSEGYAQVVFGSSSQLVAYTLVAALTATLIATAAEENALHNHHDKALGWIDAVSWLLIIGVGMPVLKESSFALGAMLSAGIVSVLVAATLAGLVFSSFTLCGGAVSTLVGFAMMMLAGAFVQVGAESFASVPAVLLLASLPLVMLVPLTVRSQPRRLLTRLALIALVSAVAAFQALRPAAGADDSSTTGDQSIEDYYRSLDP